MGNLGQKRKIEILRMDIFKKIGLLPAPGICYSGFRQGQQPGGVYPSYGEVREDLLLLEKKWKYLRLYDCDKHAQTILEVIKTEKLDFRVMLGAYITAEMNNVNCPWGGGVYPEEQLKKNRQANAKKIQTLIDWANKYPEIVFSLSVGNEACVEWTDHYVPVEKVIAYAEMVKESASQPITFCENYVPWLDKLKPLALMVDFISVHTYPVWEYKSIDESLEYTKQNYFAVANLYHHKPVVITEAGWATKSNGRGIMPINANEENQKIYYQALTNWVEREGIPTFFFEAFDEPWKGSPDADEPEKHWGLFKIDRTPKIAMQNI